MFFFFFLFVIFFIKNLKEVNHVKWDRNPAAEAATPSFVAQQVWQAEPFTMWINQAYRQKHFYMEVCTHSFMVFWNCKEFINLLLQSDHLLY